ncbi:hypothetical protein niasHS_016906 [Heterodera schachtii]|uniref:Uncharacterized protein n=1 Tax=Heterodera schachtii TaxID=97005 RepID=A0ABD2I1W1_HETSC
MSDRKCRAAKVGPQMSVISWGRKCRDTATAQKRGPKRGSPKTGAQTPPTLSEASAPALHKGWLCHRPKSQKFFQHCVQIEGQRKRIFVADELDQCTDGSALFSVLPFERGYLGSQLGHAAADLEPPVRHGGRRPRRGLLSVPPGAHRPQRTSACTAQAHCLAHNPCCVVVDSGHSFTHIVPFVGGQIVRDLSALTNQLKDWISYRQLHMMDETYLVNWCKDDCCFVSTDFQRDMDRWRANRVDCVLPDFMHTTRGHVLHWGDASNRLAHKNTVDEQQQKVTLCVERFALPELLIRPGDAEVQQMGIPEHCVRPLNGWQRTSSLSTSPPPNAPISPAIKAARDDEAFRMQQHNSASGVPVLPK